MLKTRRTKKGVTVAEVCVVLAVLAIISTLVLSFTLLVNRRVEVGKAKTAFMDDVALTQTLMETWFEKVTPTGNKQSELDETTNTVTLTVGEATVFFEKDSKKLTVGESIVTLQQVTSISFEVLTNTNDSILFVTLSYQLPYEAEKTYTFCVNPYVGETVGGVV